MSDYLEEPKCTCGQKTSAGSDGLTCGNDECPLFMVPFSREDFDSAQKSYRYQLRLAFSAGVDEVVRFPVGKHHAQALEFLKKRVES